MFQLYESPRFGIRNERSHLNGEIIRSISVVVLGILIDDKSWTVYYLVVTETGDRPNLVNAEEVSISTIPAP